MLRLGPPLTSIPDGQPKYVYPTAGLLPAAGASKGGRFSYYHELDFRALALNGRG
jgi:hypothetical protein